MLIVFHKSSCCQNKKNKSVYDSAWQVLQLSISFWIAGIWQSIVVTDLNPVSLHRQPRVGPDGRHGLTGADVLV